MPSVRKKNSQRLKKYSPRFNQLSSWGSGDSPLRRILVCCSVSALLLTVGFIFVAPEITLALTPTEIRDQINQKEAEIKALEAQADVYRKNIDVSLQLSRTLKGEIARIDASLRQLGINVSITQKKIEAQELKIQELNDNIEKTTEDVVKRRGEIGEVLREINSLDNETLLASMLRTTEISDFLSEMAWLEGLEKGLSAKVNQLKQLKIVLEENLTESKAAKRELQSLLGSLQNQKKITESKKSERQALLAETKNQEQNYQKLLQETIKKQTEIEKEIFELESDLRRQIVSANLPPRQPGLFIWPIDNGYVTQEFGAVAADSLTRDFYQFHNGIDIGAKTGIGTPIRSVLGGVVIATGNNGRYAYGKWIAVKHPNNLTTLYTHLSLIGVSIGQEVSQGQVLGYMGATGLATGPHLHLTVYASETFRIENRWFGPLPLGGAVNPRDYL